MIPLSRLTWRNFLIFAHDLIGTALAVVLSMYLRFESNGFEERLPILLAILPAFLLLAAIVFYLLDLTTTKWRFASIPDALNIIRAGTILTVVLLILDYIFIAPNVYGTFFLGKVTIIIYWFLEITFLSALRFAYRYFRYTRTRNQARTMDAAPTLLVGRAADAEIVVRGVESGAIKRVWPVGILSPSSADLGQVVRRTPVLGGVTDMKEVVQDFARRNRAIKRIVMTPTAFAEGVRSESILVEARRLGLSVSRLPSLESGEVPRLKPVMVEDLLLRPAHPIDYTRLDRLIRNKSVVVTGGGGSIGAEICERVVTFGAARLLIIENSEPALYQIVEKLTERGSGEIIEAHVADIRDRERVHQLMKDFSPGIVFHAAALKHVPILERDWGEGVKTNIFGSINVADAARAAGAEAMVMISTDKAIEPVSMLGLTKRFAEVYCQALDQEVAETSKDKKSMRLISVRFGNVLASNGSVVPKFKAQIDAGGPVTVTHPDMVRYFMTIREACDLVITAATHAMAPPRSEVSVYVLNMGQPVKIVELAQRMIELSGLRVDHDIEIVFTGMRPGERLNEILFAKQEPTIETGLPGILSAKSSWAAMDSVRKWVDVLEDAIVTDDRARAMSVMIEAVPEFGGVQPAKGEAKTFQ